jgi:hypothetical protein
VFLGGTLSAALFFGSLWGGMPDGPAIQIWRKDNKKNITVASPTEAAEYIDGRAPADADVYTCAGLAPRVLSKPSTTRTLAAGVSGIPGLWADIDVNGGPEGKRGAASSFEQATDLARCIMEPTLLVHSGYGIQAWWLFEDGPWIFGSDAEREQAARLVAAFQGGLRARAKAQEWNIDSTHDLARLMRVPGTNNCKGDQPVPVTLLEDDGPRHSHDALGTVVQEFISAQKEAAASVAAGDEIELRGENASPPMLRLEQVMDAIGDFRIVWDHRPSAHTRDWSLSQFEMSIANYLARAGFSDQEMADTLVYHRLRHGDPKGKAHRRDYIQTLINKARRGMEDDADEEEEALERDDAMDELASMGKNGNSEPTKATALFSKVIGGPAIKELIQDGRDPDTARFRVVLAD